MPEEWWGEGQEDASWKTGSDAKRERIEQYIEWLLTPKDLREPSSKQKFSDELGVHVNTLRNYDKDPAFQRQLMKDARTVSRVNRLPDLLESLYRISQGQNADGKTKTNRFGEEVFPSPAASVTAAKTLIDHMTNLAPDEGEEAVDLESMDDDALANLAVKLLQRVSDG